MATYRAEWEVEGKVKFKDFHSKPEGEKFVMLPRPYVVKLKRYKDSN